jgi:hypothetical protein
MFLFGLSNVFEKKLFIAVSWQLNQRKTKGHGDDIEASTDGKNSLSRVRVHQYGIEQQ